jgi:hypothetical protein
VIDVQAEWDRAWTRELAEADEAGVPRAEWRASKIGRATKVKPIPDTEDGAWWSREGPGMVRSAMQWIEAGGWQTVEVEPGLPAVELDVTGYIGDILVKCYIDWVAASRTGELFILDWKSGKRNSGKLLQLATGAVLLEKKYGLQASYGAFLMPRDEDPLKGPLNLSRLTEDVLYRAKYGPMRGQIDRGEFPFTLGKHCEGFDGNWSCDVSHACHAYGGAEAHLFDPLAKSA